MIAVNDLLKLAMEGHSGQRREEQVSWFRASGPGRKSFGS